MDKHVEILVIGAGQAGLAIGYYLKQTNRSFLVVDGSKRIGDSWRNRYDSLILFSPRRYSALPGLDLTGNTEGFPSKDEIADYLEYYARHFSIPVRLNTKVGELKKKANLFLAITSQGSYTAENVVIATGPFQKPFIPNLQGTLSEDIYQIHSSEYRRPSQLLDESVLVVGAGNSGLQIAGELSQSRKVYLSAGHEIKLVPHRILNRSIFWWFYKLGISKISVDSRLAKYLENEPIIGTEQKPLLKSGHIEVKPRTQSFHDKEIDFEDGTKITVNNIVWATGFQYDFDWINIPGVLNSQNKPVHKRGISPVKGIYFLGLHWLYRRDSAQLSGISYDAKYLYEHLKIH